MEFCIPFSAADGSMILQPFLANSLLLDQDSITHSCVVCVYTSAINCMYVCMYKLILIEAIYIYRGLEV